MLLNRFVSRTLRSDEGGLGSTRGGAPDKHYMIHNLTNTEARSLRETLPARLRALLDQAQT